MQAFTYRITDPVGIHARPAGLLVKLARELDSKITVEKDGNSAGGTKLMALMALGVKEGDRVTVTLEGGDEEKNLTRVQEFFREHL